MSIPGGGQGGPNLNFNVNLNLSPVEAAARRLEQIAQQAGRNVERSLTIQGRINVGANEVADHLQRIQRNVAAANSGIVASTTQAHTQINSGWANVVRLQTAAAQQGQSAWQNYYNFLRTQHAQTVAQIRAQPIPAAAPAAAGGGVAGFLQNENVQTIAGAGVRGFGRGVGAGAGVPIGIGITGVAAAGIAAAAAVENLTRATIAGVAGGIQYNAQLELAALTMKQLTGSSTEAAAALQELRKYANLTPFNTQEVIQSGQAFMRVAQGSREEMLEFVKAAGALATTNPAQGLEGATYAIRELLSGDLQSIADRFNVSRRAIRGFMEEGLNGLPLVNRVLQELGVSAKTVEEQNKTFAGSLSNVTSFAENFMQSLTAGTFQGISEELLQLSEHLKNHGDQWLAAAEKLGVFIDKAGDGLKQTALLGQLQLLGTALQFIVENTPLGQSQGAEAPAAQAVSQQMAAAKQAEKEVTDEKTKQTAALERTKNAITANQSALQAVKLEAAQITAEYQRQIGPLQRQLELINRPNFARQRQQAGLDIQQNQLNQARQGAQAPVEMRAEAAAAQTHLDVAERIAAIEARRAEIAQDFVDFASRGKTQLEQQATELEKQVRGMQRMQQAMQEIRQIRMETLREEVQSVAEARDVRLDSLREEIRLASEARSTRLDSLREEIRVAQEQRQEAAQTARDLQTEYDEAYTAIERASDRAHSHQMQNFNDQIEALRKQADIKRGPSAAEQELAALDANERAHQRDEALEDARRRVSKARTIPERAEARGDLQDLMHSQSVDVKREQLQQKIKAEKEAEEKRREQIEAKIAQIQETARNADRAFQTEKENREINREAELQTRRQQDREAERADRATQKSEQESIRVAEAADKIAAKAEKEATRVQELADKAADKAETAALKAQEKADREAERTEKAGLQDAQRAAEETREAATLAREQREDARQAAADQRQATQHGLELTRLGIEEGLLKSQDTARLAQVNAEQVRLENTRLTLAAEEGIEQANKRILASGIEEKILALKDAEYSRLDAVNEQVQQYQLQSQILEQLATSQKVKIDELNEAIKEAQALRSRIRTEELEAAKTGGGDGDDKSDPTARGQSVGQKIADAVIAAVQLAFKSDTITGQEVDGWVDQNIERPAFEGIEAESPSKLFMRLADSCIEGFNTQLAARAPETHTAVADLFIGAKTAADNNLVPLIDGIKEKWNSLPQIFADKQQEIITNITAPFKNVTDTFLPTLQTAFNNSGINSVVQWINGWNSNNVYSFVLKAFQDIIDNVLNKLGDIFKGSGINAAVGWINGFNAQIGQAKNNIVQTVQNIGGNIQQGAQNVQQAVQQRSDPLPNLFRASGGNMFPGQMYRVNEDQQFMEVFEPMRARQTGAAYAGGNFGSGGQAPNISVTVADGAVRVTTSIDNATMRALGDKIGQDVMDTVVRTLDEAQRYSPNPARRTLAGAE